jgi:hypothetical protein
MSASVITTERIACHNLHEQELQKFLQFVLFIKKATKQKVCEKKLFTNKHSRIRKTMIVITLRIH